MAYVLGFFTADGNMMENKRGAHFIEFQITDKKLLEKIRNVLESNHKITRRKRNFNHKTIYRLQIGSKIMFNDLLSLGITPQKSKTVNLPLIPKRYLSDFVRGYFDGDGNVTVSEYVRKARKNQKAKVILSGFISGSKVFLENLHKKLKELSGISGGTLYYSSRGYRLYFSKRDSLTLYRFMYGKTSNTLYLHRKKFVFEKYFKIV